MSKSVIPFIESVYKDFTKVEKIIANFFIDNIDSNSETDLSAKNISKKLSVSEASLTRFAKKCRYSGYREFVYAYKKSASENLPFQHQVTKRVLADYNEILKKTYSLIDEKQIKRIAKLILNADRIFLYGIVSSGLTALEMKSRFMRLGLYCDAFVEPDMMKMNSALADENSVIIALSISSDSSVILSSLKQAHHNGAKTILFTANKIEKFKDVCDEIVSVATSKKLNYGNKISPQFPLLVMLDILYANLFDSDLSSTTEKFSSTLGALNK